MREEKTIRISESSHELLLAYAAAHGDMSLDQCISQLLSGAMRRNRALAQSMRLALDGKEVSD